MTAEVSKTVTGHLGLLVFSALVFNEAETVDCENNTELANFKITVLVDSRTPVVTVVTASVI